MASRKAATLENVRFLAIYKDGLCLRDALFRESFYTDFLGKEQMFLRYRIGSKVLERTYRREKRRNPRKFLRQCRLKYSILSRGNTRGYTGPPRPLIPKKDLVACFDKGMRRCDVVAKFKITDFLLDRNLKHWNLSDSFKTSLKKVPFRSVIENEELLASLDALVPGCFSAVMASVRNPQKALDAVFKAHLRVQYVASVVQQLGVKLRNRCLRAKNRYSFTSNRGEIAIAGWLLSNGFRFKQQHKVGDFFYDFYLPSERVLIEVDGSAHKRGIRSNSALSHTKKDKEAKRVGLRLIRVPWSDKSVVDLAALAQSLNL